MLKNFSLFDGFLTGLLLVILIGNFVVFPLTKQDTHESSGNRPYHEVRNSGG